MFTKSMDWKLLFHKGRSERARDVESFYCCNNMWKCKYNVKDFY